MHARVSGCDECGVAWCAAALAWLRAWCGMAESRSLVLCSSEQTDWANDSKGCEEMHFGYFQDAMFEVAGASCACVFVDSTGRTGAQEWLWPASAVARVVIIDVRCRGERRHLEWLRHCRVVRPRLDDAVDMFDVRRRGGADVAR